MHLTTRRDFIINWSALLVLVLYCLVVPSVAVKHDHVACAHEALSVPLSTLPAVDVVYSNDVRRKQPIGDAAQQATLVGSEAEPRLLSSRSSSSSGPLRFHLIYPDGFRCSTVGQQYLTTVGTTATCAEDDVVAGAKLLVLERTLEGALRFLSNAYSTTPSTAVDSIDVPANVCSGLRSAATTVRGSDFVLFVTALPQTDTGAASPLAWGKPCARLAGDARARPVVGHINFVPSALPRLAARARDVSVAMHEVTHALGFVSLFDTLSGYVDLDGTWHASGGTQMVFRPALGKSVMLVSTPRVLREARKHFGCPTLDGVEIEDMGGTGTAGSHWKKRLLYEEALVGVVTSARLFYSSITMAFFEDAGFLVANYSMAQDNFGWGRNAGCDFTNLKCDTLYHRGHPEFCFGSADTVIGGKKVNSECTADRFSVGACDMTLFTAALPSIYQYIASDARVGGLQPTMDYCPVVVPYNNVICTDPSMVPVQNIYGDEFGPDSRCYNTSLVTAAFPTGKLAPRCLRTSCTPSQVLLSVQGQTLAFPRNLTASDMSLSTASLFGVHGSFSITEGEDGKTDAVCNTFDAPLIQSASTSVSVKGPTAGKHDDVSHCTTRAAQCDAALSRLFPLCGHLASATVQCFGGCRQEMSMWLSHRYHNTCNHDLESRSALASACLDGWPGVVTLCKVVSNGAFLSFSVNGLTILLYSALMLFIL